MPENNYIQNFYKLYNEINVAIVKLGPCIRGVLVKAPTAIDAIPAAIRADMVSDINICPADTLLYTIASFINFPSLSITPRENIHNNFWYKRN